MGDPIVIIPPGGYYDGFCSDSYGSGFGYCGADANVLGAVDCCPV